MEMRYHPTVPMFDCEFKCSCGSVIGWRGPEALVKSQTGAHVHCKHCRSVWSVTPAGATLVEADASFLLETSLRATESAEPASGDTGVPSEQPNPPASL